MSGNKQLGAFLRSRRHRLDPAALGLPFARPRRTPGLRREEVADRAGISCEWYIKLEQGREVSASDETLAALARALMLDGVEAAHLHKLAGQRAAPCFVRETVPHTIQAIVRGLAEPAYITGARWDVLCWNGSADDLLRFSDMPESERNILRYMLTSPAARDLFGPSWAEEAQRMIAMFRTTYDQRRSDPLFEDLVLALDAGSMEFRDWWRSYRVATSSSGSKTLQPEGRNGTRFIYATFQANDDPALKLALYTRVD
ncbi:helix-turn-helix transcriptional regulator [Lichenihabitans sp. PAMC28606]|uniref:helix-turn-helix transcriptional regulator n=1 Tax=Lichenihabitans sp. PAMC28606 TaxID=2880932 RepID=UPI001D0BAC21|nr:helix-turn-helix transcriptional regulator [Lichenihabitans sp. PAMC28606]UDL94070.1 helix-turn-helix transcriptional regulator [Lichenihabitans sp. PAMC28606]